MKSRESMFYGHILTNMTSSWIDVSELVSSSVEISTDVDRLQNAVTEIFAGVEKRLTLLEKVKNISCYL